MSRLLHDLVTAQAERRAEAPAIVLGDDAWTYGLLERRSNQLARVLIDHGCRPGDRVCLLAPKSPAAIAAILAIYKAGAVYVPLDPASPAARLQRIMAACEPQSLLVTRGTAALAGHLLQLGAPRTVVTGSLESGPIEGDTVRTAFDLGSAAEVSDARPDIARDDDAPAHILFTSGSTGMPKGVVITHANVWNFVAWANKYFGVRSRDRQSLHSPLAFDLSTYDIFGTLAAGASLYPVPAELNVLPNKLAEFIRRARLTQWFSAPSVLSYMAQLDVVDNGDFPSLERVIWCGEVFPIPALRYWMLRIPHATFTNLYGPTEATIASSYYRVPSVPDEDALPVPIGTACPGEELLVLDEDRRPVSAGAIGEICLAGSGLSPGYWREPELTDAAFVIYDDGRGGARRIYRTGDLGRVDPQGLVHFVGRRDSQIKSRGHRIELGEIEAALHALPDLRESAVVAVPSDGFGGTVVCCAYVPVSGAQVTPATLRRQLAAVLPPYMLPSQWKAFDRLPLNGNGKTDRGVLRRTFAESTAVMVH
jgi:amino acid adenylation domain-containing protein